MGFFYNSAAQSQGSAKRAISRKGWDASIYNRGECKVCPLRSTWKSLAHPNMEPTGSCKPDIYVLGEAPGETEDDNGEQFIGKAGSLLRPLLEKAGYAVRWNNVIRCHPARNNTPGDPEIESCRPSVERDIASSKPTLIMGFGNVPLHWVSGISQISLWRGRMFPVRVGGHECWYFCVNHPSYVQRHDKRNDINPHRVIFELDIKHALQLLKEGLPEAHVWGAEEAVESKLVRGLAYEAGETVEWLQELSRYPTSTDLETTHLAPYYPDSRILLISAASVDKGISFVWDHPASTWNPKQRDKVLQAYYDYLMSGQVIAAHNAKFEQKWLGHLFHTNLLHANWHDTMGSGHTLDERPGALSLDDLCFQRFGFHLKAYTGVDPAQWRGVDLKDFLLYNLLDSVWCARLDSVDTQVVSLVPAYSRECARAVRVGKTLVLTESIGVSPDLVNAKVLQDKLNGELEEASAQFLKSPDVLEYIEDTGNTPVVTSPDTLVAFYRWMGRPEIQKKGGGFTTDEDALSLMPASEVPSAAFVLATRAVSKLLSTYIMPIINGKIVFPDGLIHTVYNHLLVVTGRLSSESPNLQNFPKRKHKEIRAVIRAAVRWWMAKYYPGVPILLASLDYGQIEARVIAMASEDENLVKALWTGFDIHGFWADYLIDAYPKIKDRMVRDYGLKRADAALIRKNVRNEIKNGWVFPQFYGSIVDSCAANLQIPVPIAREMGNLFWSEFQGVKRWQQRTISKWERTGYVETLTGRRRRGPMSVNEIINTCSQGTASDLVVDAMCELSESWQFDTSGTLDDRFQACMNIHDDLTFGFPETDVMENIEFAARIMCGVADRYDFINVPISVEASVGRNWYDQEEVATYSSEDFKKK